MLSVDSKLWSVRGFNAGGVHITQRASGAIRTVSRGVLPSDSALAAMTERQFDAVCREAFHDAASR